SDQQLLQRFSTLREEAAFTTLVERHGPMVLGVCRAMLHHVQDAEDVCQATFLVLARKARSIRKPASLAPWLHGVACRLARRVKAGRDRTYDRRANPRAQLTPMDELTGRELRQILHEELALLPESYRLPLILCYLEGLTKDEAALRLGWTATTLKGRVDRGRNLLRRRPERRGLTLGLPLLVASLSKNAARAGLPGPGIGRAARAATRFLETGQVEANVGRAGALAMEWEKAMLTLNLKIGAALVLVVGILGASAGLAAYQARESESPDSRQKNERITQPKPDRTEGKQERVDGRGDVLPESAVVRFGSARLRHGGAIRASALSPDGNTLVTAGDHSVIVWDLHTGKTLHRFRCDRGTTYCRPGLTISPDGTRLGYVRGSLFSCV